MSSKIDYNKTVHNIIHGQIQLLDQVEQKLMSKGIKRVRMRKASLVKAGEQGEYVAMLWPPMDAKEIIVCEIVGRTADLKEKSAIGAWSNVEQKEVYRILLKK